MVAIITFSRRTETRIARRSSWTAAVGEGSIAADSERASAVGERARAREAAIWCKCYYGICHDASLVDRRTQHGPAGRRAPRPRRGNLPASLHSYYSPLAYASQFPRIISYEINRMCTLIINYIRTNKCCRSNECLFKNKFGRSLSQAFENVFEAKSVGLSCQWVM